MPTYSRGRTQTRIAVALSLAGQERPLFTVTELRLQLSPELVRIPDVCAFAETEPAEEIPTRPPYVTVEIVSPDDRYSELVQKLNEYWTWGVKHVWLAGPCTRKLSVYDSAGLHEVTAFSLPEFDLHITAADLF
jgi:Uma2 family endonuclease